MLKVLSTSALSLALAGSAVFAGVSGTDSAVKQDSKYEISLAHHVGAAPELVDKAKELGIDLSKVDPAEKAAQHGTKFQEPGDNHVAYKESKGDVPVLVLLAKYKDGDEPVGDMPGQVPANYYEDLIFGTEYNPYELEQFKQYDGPDVPKDRTMQNAYKESSYGAVNLVRKENTEFVDRKSVV